MAMDFFEHQEQARRKTGRLVVLFIVAVICTVVCVNVVTVFMLATQDAGDAIPAGIAVTTLGVLAVIGIGTAVKSAQMSAGGVAVAEALGGTPLRPDTRDADERRVLNVVEEMAIASGLPVPPVYLLNDKSINAFAAGRTPSDSVIGLTRGCVQNLS
ncbi:MAG: M48 family metalloprotease, partial [Phycisphaerae bacterium]|nr:M48 family metalloprotease [Phycisphaerae bacterium]